MGTIQTSICKVVGGISLRGFFVFFLLFSLSILSLPAQESDSIANADSLAQADTSDGPSLANISKSLVSGGEELQKLRQEELEKIRHDEIMSYIYMGLGFSVVIFIAWFTTVLARKRKRKENEERASRVHSTKHKPHHPRR